MTWLNSPTDGSAAPASDQPRAQTIRGCKHVLAAFFSGTTDIKVGSRGENGLDLPFAIGDLLFERRVEKRPGPDKKKHFVDNLTNRYDSVGDANLSYDSAGNLTADKDGYEHEYDYENRIVKITKDGNDIREFACDVPGRRIIKMESVARTTNGPCDPLSQKA
ncbi:MAG TPA: hypothetical protein VMX13_17010 [Sedimentisphaerales bacterium]|nr:hypothetical protein [Sedimentisphaerales bacterium]